VSRKDINRLLRAIEAEGGRVARSKGQHWKIYRGPRLVTTIGSTPSDHRSWLNGICQLRRNGFELPGY
jgi:hypothetical protein